MYLIKKIFEKCRKVGQRKMAVMLRTKGKNDQALDIILKNNNFSRIHTLK